MKETLDVAVVCSDAVAVEHVLALPGLDVAADAGPSVGACAHFHRERVIRVRRRTQTTYGASRRRNRRGRSWFAETSEHCFSDEHGDRPTHVQVALPSPCTAGVKRPTRASARKGEMTCVEGQHPRCVLLLWHSPSTSWGDLLAIGVQAASRRV